MIRCTSRGSLRLLATLAAFALPAIAMAHPGHEGIPMHAGESMAEGLLHPLTGLDHLAAMVSVGLWSALSVRQLRDAIVAPLSFALLLLVGALLGIGGVQFPATEQMIAASVLVLGLLVATRIHLPIWAGATLVGAFALFHGAAHGAELPATAMTYWFIGGFMLSTIVLHLCGMALGLALRDRSAWISRIAGAAIGLYGVALLAA